MKYYYTDPLIVAYMAREFRIHTDQGDREKGDYIINDPSSYFLFLKEELPKVINNPEHGNKYYIHVTSLATLNPQIGDLIDNYEEGWVGIVDKKESYYDMSVRRDGGNYIDDYAEIKAERDNQVKLDKVNLVLWNQQENRPAFWNPLNDKDRGCKIIQRNGKAWFTPERED